jgi:hypothetical protein
MQRGYLGAIGHTIEHVMDYSYKDNYLRIISDKVASGELPRGQPPVSLAAAAKAMLSEAAE